MPNDLDMCCPQLPQRIIGQMWKTNSHPTRCDFNLDLQTQLTSAEFKEKCKIFLYTSWFQTQYLVVVCMSTCQVCIVFPFEVSIINLIAFCCTSRLEKGDLSCSQVLYVLQTLHLSSAATWLWEANFQKVSDPFLRQGRTDIENLQSVSASIQVDLYDDDRNISVNV